MSLWNSGPDRPWAYQTISQLLGNASNLKEVNGLVKPACPGLWTRAKARSISRLNKKKKKLKVEKWKWALNFFWQVMRFPGKKLGPFFSRPFFVSGSFLSVESWLVLLQQRTSCKLPKTRHLSGFTKLVSPLTKYRIRFSFKWQVLLSNKWGSLTFLIS